MTAMAYAVRSRGRRPAGAAVGLTWLLAATTVGLQIAYPLVGDRWLDRVTIATVVAFAATCVLHALVHRGLGWTLGLVAVTAGGGLVAEAVGVRTGLPFGDYSYAGTLGPEVLDVPLVVPLAWTMMAYPVLLAARRLTRRWVVPAAAVRAGRLGRVPRPADGQRRPLDLGRPGRRRCPVSPASRSRTSPAGWSSAR